MRIELQVNQVVVTQGEMDSIVGLVTVPLGYLLPAHRKPVKNRHRKKGKIKLATVIDSLIDGIREEK